MTDANSREIERNIAMELVRVTEAAAMAAARFLGRERLSHAGRSMAGGARHGSGDSGNAADADRGGAEAPVGLTAGKGPRIISGRTQRRGIRSQPWQCWR